MILIEKDKAVEETWRMPSYSDPLNVLTEVRDRIKALPTIEIVRCGECKHYTNGFCYNYRTCGNKAPDFFCADGERGQDG